ncbi:MAG: hypothetical protein AAGI01_00810 [Myxococcota bacterium]
MWTALADMTRWLLVRLDRPVGPADGKRFGNERRGVAMMIVLVTIALLSAVTVEFAYSTRVNFAMAANERDKVKSYFMAKSAVNLTRLLLSFQVALQRESRATDDDMGRLINRAIRRSNFQIYQYVDLLMKPFHSGKIETPVGGLDLQETGVEGFGNFTGEFTAEVRPEAGRIDINMFFKEETDDNDLAILCAMFIDPQYDEMFLRKDDYGNPLDRGTVIQNIVDFIDPDNEAISLDQQCKKVGGGGDESRNYTRDQKLRIRPRDAKLTHPEDLYQIHGVGDEFIDAFGSQFTVYNVGKPNINVADAVMFYSVLCQNVTLATGAGEVRGFDLCARQPQVAAQVLYFALALDGIRSFFEDPLSVLLAYVGSQESKLLPSAKKGQPVAFLSVSQFPRFIEDLKASPQLMAQFLQYSPAYQRMLATNPAMLVDPLTPQLPQWTISFDRSGLTRSVTTQSPEIYRIEAKGMYGTTTSTIEVVLDMGKTFRRLPDEEQLEEREQDTEDLRELKQQLREQREAMPKGRVMYWREY